MATKLTLPKQAPKAPKAPRAVTAEQAEQAQKAVTAFSYDKLTQFQNNNPQLKTFLANYEDPTELNSYIDALTNRAAVSKEFGDTWGTISTTVGQLSTLATLAATIVQAGAWIASALLPDAGTIAAAGTVISKAMLAANTVAKTAGTVAAVVAAPAAVKVTIDKGIKPILAGKSNEALVNTMINLGETLDAQPNLVKGFVMDGTKGFTKALGATDSGRTNYDFDTGSMAVDMALEILVDPLNIEYVNKHSLKVAANTALKESAQQISNVLPTAIKRTVPDMPINATQIQAIETAITKSFTNQQLVEVLQIGATQGVSSPAYLKELQKLKDRTQRAITRTLKKQFPNITEIQIKNILEYTNKTNRNITAFETIWRTLDNTQMDLLATDTIKALAESTQYTDEYQRYLLKNVWRTSGFGAITTVGGTFVKTTGNLFQWAHNKLIKSLTSTGLMQHSHLQLKGWDDIKLMWTSSQQYIKLITGETVQQGNIDSLYHTVQIQLNTDLRNIKQLIMQHANQPNVADGAIQDYCQTYYKQTFAEFINSLEHISAQEFNVLDAYIAQFKQLQQQTHFAALNKALHTTGNLFNMYNVEELRSGFSGVKNQVQQLLDRLKLSGKVTDIEDAKKIYEKKLTEDTVNVLLITDLTINNMFTLVNDGHPFIQGLTELSNYFPGDMVLCNHITALQKAGTLYTQTQTLYRSINTLALPEVPGVPHLKRYIIEQLYGLQGSVSEQLVNVEQLVTHALHGVETLVGPEFNAALYPGIQVSVQKVYQLFLQNLKLAGIEDMHFAVLHNVLDSFRYIVKFVEAQQVQPLLDSISIIQAGVEAVSKLLDYVKSMDRECAILLSDNIFSLTNGRILRELSDLGFSLRIKGETENLRYFTSITDLQNLNIITAANEFGTQLNHYSTQIRKHQLTIKPTVIAKAYKATIEFIDAHKQSVPEVWRHLKATTDPIERWAIVAQIHKEMQGLSVKRVLNKANRTYQDYMFKLAGDSTLARRNLEYVLHPDYYFITEYATDMFAESNIKNLGLTRFSREVRYELDKQRELQRFIDAETKSYRDLFNTLERTGADFPLQLQHERVTVAIDKVAQTLDQLSEKQLQTINYQMITEYVESIQKICNRYPDFVRLCAQHSLDIDQILDTLQQYFNNVKLTPEQFQQLSKQIYDLNTLCNTEILSRYNKEAYEAYQTTAKAIKENFKYDEQAQAIARQTAQGTLPGWSYGDLQDAVRGIYKSNIDVTISDPVTQVSVSPNWARAYRTVLGYAYSLAPKNIDDVAEYADEINELRTAAQRTIKNTELDDYTQTILQLFEEQLAHVKNTSPTLSEAQQVQKAIDRFNTQFTQRYAKESTHTPVRAAPQTLGQAKQRAFEQLQYELQFMHDIYGEDHESVLSDFFKEMSKYSAAKIRWEADINPFRDARTLQNLARRQYANTVYRQYARVPESMPASFSDVQAIFNNINDAYLQEYQQALSTFETMFGKLNKAQYLHYIDSTPELQPFLKQAIIDYLLTTAPTQLNREYPLHSIRNLNLDTIQTLHKQALKLQYEHNVTEQALVPIIQQTKGPVPIDTATASQITVPAAFYQQESLQSRLEWIKKNYYNFEDLEQEVLNLEQDLQTRLLQLFPAHKATKRIQKAVQQLDLREIYVPTLDPQISTLNDIQLQYFGTFWEDLNNTLTAHYPKSAQAYTDTLNTVRKEIEEHFREITKKYYMSPKTRVHTYNRARRDIEFAKLRKEYSAELTQIRHEINQTIMDTLQADFPTITMKQWNQLHTQIYRSKTGQYYSRTVPITNIQWIENEAYAIKHLRQQNQNTLSKLGIPEEYSQQLFQRMLAQFNKESDELLDKYNTLTYTILRNNANDDIYGQFPIYVRSKMDYVPVGTEIIDTKQYNKFVSKEVPDLPEQVLKQYTAEHKHFVVNDAVFGPRLPELKDITGIMPGLTDVEIATWNRTMANNIEKYLLQLSKIIADNDHFSTADKKFLQTLLPVLQEAKNLQNTAITRNVATRIASITKYELNHLSPDLTTRIQRICESERESFMDYVKDIIVADSKIRYGERFEAKADELFNRTMYIVNDLEYNYRQTFNQTLFNQLSDQLQDAYQAYKTETIKPLKFDLNKPFEVLKHVQRESYNIAKVNRDHALHHTLHLTLDQLKNELAYRHGIIMFRTTKDPLLNNKALRLIEQIKANPDMGLVHWWDKPTNVNYIGLSKKVQWRMHQGQAYLDATPVLRAPLRTPITTVAQTLDKYLDETLEVPLSNSIESMLTNVNNSIQELTGAVFGDSQGDIMSREVLTNLYNNLPEEFKKQIPDIEFLTKSEFFDAYHFNESILGDLLLDPAFNKSFYSANAFINIQKSLANAIPYVKAKNEYIQAVFKSALSISNIQGIWAQFTDEDILEALQNTPEYRLLTLAYDKKYGLKIHEVLPTNASVIKKAKELGAIIVPLQTYKDMVNKINHKLGSNFIVQLWNKYLFLTKLGHLINPSAWVYNWLDTNLKTKLELKGEYRTYMDQAHVILNFYHKIEDLAQQAHNDGLVTDEFIFNYFKNNKDTPITFYQYRELKERFFSQTVSGVLPVKETQTVWDSVSNTASKLVNWGNRTEEYNRLAMYLYDLDHGLSYSEALTRLAKIHFDYGFRTNAERLVEMVFPFYTFKLRNMSYWAEMLDKHPWLARQYNHLIKPTWNIDQTTPEQLTYNYALQRRIVGGQLPLFTHNDTQFSLKLNPSISSAISMFNNPIDVAKSQLAPPLKALFSQYQRPTDMIPVAGPIIANVQTGIKNRNPLPMFLATNKNYEGINTYTDKTYRTPRYRKNVVYDAYKTKGVYRYRMNLYPIIDVAHDVKMRYSVNVYNRIKNKVQTDVYKGIRYRIRLDANRFR